MLKRWLFTLVLLVHVPLAACTPMATPADPISPPIRAVLEGGGDQVFLLTSQWKSTRSTVSRNRSDVIRTDLLIDLWAIDAKTMRPAWRTRLESVRGGTNQGRALIGVQGPVVWVFGGAGLVGYSVRDGSLVADRARIEAANPALAGKLPTEARYVSWDGAGLRVQTTDGLSWRIDPATLKATEATGAPVEAPQAGVFKPVRDSGGNSTGGFMERSVNIGQRWLGFMSDQELATYQGGDTRSYWWGSPSAPPDPRKRLYSARLGPPKSITESYYLADLTPLPEAPYFLEAGMLGDGISSPTRPLFVTEPDSVVVLHRDKLGEGAVLQLSRVQGPSGKVLWTATLGVGRISSVMPTSHSVVFMGAREENTPGISDDTQNVPVLISVDLKTGAVARYGFRVDPTDGPVIPASSD